MFTATTLTNQPLYQNPITGWSRKAIVEYLDSQGTNGLSLWLVLPI